MKTAQAAQCKKSRALTKVIDSILDIESFDQKCVVVKGSLKSEQPETKYSYHWIIPIAK